MKKIIILIAFLLALAPVFSQGYMVKIKHTGYGEEVTEVHFTIHNVGPVDIDGMELFIDGELYEAIDAYLTPGKGISKVLFLEEGRHTIEVKIDGEAYDSEEVNVVKIEPTTTIQDAPIYEEKKTPIVAILVAVVFVVLGLLWYLTRRKRRLDF